jgi:hypothetical protein
VGEPVREVCTDQRCGKCSPGFSDTLGVQVRPVGVYVGNVVMLRLQLDDRQSSFNRAVRKAQPR